MAMKCGTIVIYCVPDYLFHHSTMAVTTDDFIYDTGHDRRPYTRLTQLCEVPQNTLKIHGRVL